MSKPKPSFYKSTYSNDSGACVEVCRTDDGVMVRDSKDPNGAVLTFTPDEWTAFINGAKHHEFDL
jgi:hypothetical protein